MKSVPIHIDAIQPANTKRFLVHQQPSWKAAAICDLDRIKTKVNKWNTKRTKLIRIILDAPRHAVAMSEVSWSGQDG